VLRRLRHWPPHARLLPRHWQPSPPRQCAPRAHGQEPFEALQIVRQAINRRCHACEWSTDRAIRDLGIGQASQNATGSSRSFGPPSALRVSPINAFKHVGKLRRRDHNYAISWRGPDELAAL
jgi:hypothetical protein